VDVKMKSILYILWIHDGCAAQKRSKRRDAEQQKFFELTKKTWSSVVLVSACPNEECSNLPQPILMLRTNSIDLTSKKGRGIALVHREAEANFLSEVERQERTWASRSISKPDLEDGVSILKIRGDSLDARFWRTLPIPDPDWAGGLCYLNFNELVMKRKTAFAYMPAVNPPFTEQGHGLLETPEGSFTRATAGPGFRRSAFFIWQLGISAIWLLNSSKFFDALLIQLERLTILESSSIWAKGLRSSGRLFARLLSFPSLLTNKFDFDSVHAVQDSSFIPLLGEPMRRNSVRWVSYRDFTMRSRQMENSLAEE
jgi:hypothetical protein